MEEQDASDQLDAIGLTEEQKKAVDRVVTAYNQCGAAYGAAAYRFGIGKADTERAKGKEKTL